MLSSLEGDLGHYLGGVTVFSLVKNKHWSRCILGPHALSLWGKTLLSPSSLYLPPPEIVYSSGPAVISHMAWFPNLSHILPSFTGWLLIGIFPSHKPPVLTSATSTWAPRETNRTMNPTGQVSGFHLYAWNTKKGRHRYQIIILSHSGICYVQQARSCPREGLGYIQSALYFKNEKENGGKNSTTSPFLCC